MTDPGGVRPRCVFDTNVLISAALRAGSLPSRVVAHVARSGRVLVSTETLAELESRLQRPKFERYVSVERRQAFVELIASNAELVAVTATVSDSTDPDDNAFLALALDGRADVLISGDKRHLLPLHPWRGIPILTPRAFAEHVGLV